MKCAYPRPGEVATMGDYFSTIPKLSLSCVFGVHVVAKSKIEVLHHETSNQVLIQFLLNNC